jgi:hypothetical protein
MGRKPKVLAIAGGLVHLKPEKTRPRIKPSRMEWETQNGEVTELRDMQDKHLISAVAYLERNAYLLEANVMSDGASDWDFEAEGAEDYLVQQETYREMYTELYRRRIPVPPVTCWYLCGYPLPLKDVPRKVEYRPAKRKAA